MLLSILLLFLLLSASAQADAAEEEPDCELDSTLSEAAGELLLSARAPKSEELDDAVRAAGSDLVGVRALFAPNDDAGRVRAWLSAFKEKADADVVCGYARGESARLFVVAARGGSLEPLAETTTRLRGSLRPRFSRPEIIVSDSHGDLYRTAIDRAALSRGIPIAPDLARPARIQLVARGPNGPRPVAERVLPASGEAASEAPVDTAPAAQFDDPRSGLAALRAEHGRLALRDNRLLAGVAQAHAEAVCARGRAAHELEPGGDPKARVRRAGLEARQVGETVARARDVRGAFAALLRSPSHRMTLLERGFTEVGLGTATDSEGHSCLVVLLAAWPRYVGK